MPKLLYPPSPPPCVNMDGGNEDVVEKKGASISGIRGVRWWDGGILIVEENNWFSSGFREAVGCVGWMEGF